MSAPLKYLFVALLAGLMCPTMAQDQGFIYGTVTTRTGNSYTGHIRWGKEETFWSDLYNASKLNNKIFGHILKKQTPKSEDSWLGMDWDLGSIWEDKYSGTVHSFTCMFGNIQAMENLGSNRVRMTLKNGGKILIGGSGYNDITSSIEVYDEELGLVKISQSQVQKVEFAPTPPRLSNKSGDPLFGHIVTVADDTLTGLLMWDKQERVSTEKLDGNTRGERLAVEFGKILILQPAGSSCDVVLRSGRKIRLSGTNDVDSRNRGAVVWIAGTGRLEVPWEQIYQMKIDPAASTSGNAFTTYGSPRGLRGTAHLLEGGSITGRIAYDLDEVWEFEMLEGKSNNIEYQIPFWNIKRITPRNRYYSVVELRSGKRLVLGKMRDVSDDNDGLLVFPSEKAEPRLVKWHELDNIEFD